jgi:MFS family permease
VDLLGAKRILLIGIALFTIASALCGLAINGPMLFGARAFQGLGAALVSPAALTLVTSSFAEGDARNRAFGIWGAVASTGMVAGNLVGGVLTGLASWEWVFGINVPIGLVVVLGVAAFVGRDDVAARPHTDILGASLLTAGSVLLVSALSQLSHGLTTPVIASGGLGIALLAGFLVVEHRVPEPIVRLELFRNPSVRYGNLLTAVGAASGLAATWFGTLYMQNVLQLDPLLAGFGFLPMALATVVVSSLTGRLVARYGVGKLLGASALLLAVGLLSLGLLATSNGSYWTSVLPGMLVSGVGFGLSFAPSLIVATTGVRAEDQGLASGLVNTSPLLGGAVGLAVLNSVAVAGGSYRVGFLAAVVSPLLMLACVAAWTRRQVPVGGGTADQIKGRPRTRIPGSRCDHLPAEPPARTTGRERTGVPRKL